LEQKPPHKVVIWMVLARFEVFAIFCFFLVWFIWMVCGVSFISITVDVDDNVYGSQKIAYGLTTVGTKSATVIFLVGEPKMAAKLG
jgi:hypothetical protein